MSKSDTKILYITRNLPPLVGGMERLNYHIYLALKEFCNISVIGPSGCKKIIWSTNVIEVPVKPIWKYLLIGLFKTIKFSFGKRFNFIFCGSGVAILSGYAASRLTSSQLVCYLHGLDIVAKSLVYQRVFIPLIKKSHLIIVNSHFTKGLAINAGVDPHKIKILHPGVEIPNFDSPSFIADSFKEKYQLQNKTVILIAGRITARKGIVEFVENVMLDLIAEVEGIHLVIAGAEAGDAINRQSGIEEGIGLAVNRLNLQQHVTLTGSLSEHDLHAAFFASELLVFPVLDLPGDVEGFGMIAVEAAAHGIPTVGFNVGGVSDAISHGVSGFVVSSGDYEEMKNKIAYLLAHRDQFGCLQHAHQFEWSKFSVKLKAIIESQINEQ